MKQGSHTPNVTNGVFAINVSMALRMRMLFYASLHHADSHRLRRSLFVCSRGFARTPDDSHIVMWAKGKIVSIDVATGIAEDIQFMVHVELRLAETAKANAVYS